MRYISLVVFLGVTLNSMALAETPVTQPALKETDPVRVNGLDFQLVASVVWVTPAEKHETTIPLKLKVTNQTDKAVQLDLFDTLNIQMKDAEGTELRMVATRDRSFRPNPLTVDKGQIGTIDRTAKLQPLDEKLGQVRLVGSDGAGGIWYFDGLKPGKHTVRITYQNAEAGTKDVPIWVGKATTNELTVEIADTQAPNTPP